MKVVHLSTHDVRGGAAAAAWRLHGAMVEQGIDSRMVVRTRHREDARVSATDDGTQAIWHEGIITPWLRRNGPSGLPWFTVGATELPLKTHPWIQEADILHLHWVCEWLGVDSIRRLASLGKPVVWTFHDLWPVTGGAHYAGHNAPQGDAWQRGSALPEPPRSISQREFERKLTAWSSLPLQVISPSRWLAQIAQTSLIGAGWRFTTIANGIDTTVFTPGDRKAARARWNIPDDVTVLLFGCASLSDPRKGFAQLQSALQTLPRDHVSLVLFGHDSVTLDYPHQRVGAVNDPADMASLYRAADAFLAPALEDNLPTTMIESLACGTPVIGFATGGVPDLVKDGVNGLLAPCGDTQALAAQLQRFLSDPPLRAQLSQTAGAADKACFGLAAQVGATMELYRTCQRRESGLPLPPMAQGALPFTLLPDEMPWIQAAVADAMLQGREREQSLREKLRVTREKLDKAKARPASSPPPQAKDKPWWKFGS